MADAGWLLMMLMINPRRFFITLTLLVTVTLFAGCASKKTISKPPVIVDHSITKNTERQLIIKNAARSWFGGNIKDAKSWLNRVLIVDSEHSKANDLLGKINADMKPYTLYLVKPGDSLTLISQQQLGSANYYSLLSYLNRLDNPNNLEPGQAIKIPVDSIIHLISNIHKTNQKKSSKSVVVVSTPDQQPTQEVDPEETFQYAKRLHDERDYLASISVLTSSDEFKKPKAEHLKEKIQQLLIANFNTYRDDLIQKKSHSEILTYFKDSLQEQTDPKVRSHIQALINQIGNQILLSKAEQLVLNNNIDDAYHSLHKLRTNDVSMENSEVYQRVFQSIFNDYHKRALILYRNQRLQKSIEKWNDILKLDPDNEAALVYRARARELQRRLEKFTTTNPKSYQSLRSYQ